MNAVHPGMNRAQRRAARAHARKAAARFYETTPSGTLARVTHPTQAILAVAFEAVLIEWQPGFRQFTEDEARAFRSWTPEAEGLAHVLAIGIDIGGHLTSSLVSAGLAEEATAVAFERLLRSCAIDGFATTHAAEARA